jgi:hypothetical protein
VARASRPCPVDAWFAEDQVHKEWERYTQINADWYARSLTP